MLAEPSAASAVRGLLRRWLVGRRWPDQMTDDIVMAASEAVANVIDHAYRRHATPGDAHIYAWTLIDAADRRVAVSVTDHGRWRPAPADPGHRGHGLVVMGACMAEVHIEHNVGGTSVTMISAAVRHDGR